MSKIKNNVLLNISEEIFSLVYKFKLQCKNECVTGDFANIITRAFGALENKAFKANIPSNLFLELKYILVAFVDEMILSSSWPEKSTWQAQPLQVKFFSECLAGEVFFTKLSQLKREPFNNLDLLEVYYICLQLGFSGHYLTKNSHELLALKSELHETIKKFRDKTNFPPHYLKVGTLQKFSKWSRILPFWLTLFNALALTALIYGGFIIAEQQHVHAFINDLNRQSQANSNRDADDAQLYY